MFMKSRDGGEKEEIDKTRQDRTRLKTRHYYKDA